MVNDSMRRWAFAAIAGVALSVASALAGAGSGGAAMVGALGAVLVLAVLLATRTPEAAIRPENRTRSGVRAIAAIDAIAGMANPCLMFDRRGIVVNANEAARRTFPGLETGIVLRQWFRDGDLLDDLEQVLAGVAHASGMLVERRPVERAFRVDLSLIAPQADYGLMMFIDQTESIRIDKVRADFIANASHELRTPLTAVSGFLETLQGAARNDPVNRDRFIALMLEQTQRMARLIDDLLSLSRLETQSAPDKTERIDLGRLAATTAASLASLTAQVGVTVRIDVPQGAVMIDGNADELTQVVQNLIENACKYAAKGKFIDIGMAQMAGEKETGLYVRDHGAGIPPEHIPRLTERFYRVSVQESRQQKGTGLGLAIVKHILTRHRARLVIESRQAPHPEPGSTFTLVFPKP